VQVYDLLSVAGGRGIVQEFIEGNDLWGTESHATTPLELGKQLWQIAAGIDDIHKAGVIHRDIKPNNMKIDPESVIKIFDFGLARNEGINASTTGFVGTFGFAAPELFDANPQFTPAVDVYAFGASSFHMIAGGLPHHMVRPTRPVELPPSVLDQYHSGLSESILRIIEACMRVDPLARPTMSEVRSILAKELLRDRHRALLVHRGEPAHLHSGKRSVRANWDGVGSITIGYDGLNFIATVVEGDVYINYGVAVTGQHMPGSCVITLGAPSRRSSRMYVTFDVSHPEVVL
jgi:serine/threonine-protein kinase